MRLEKLQALMETEKLDALVIAYDWNVFYFTSIPRPAGSYIFMIKGWEPKILVPALDYWRVSAHVKGVEVIPYSRYEIPGIEAKPVTMPLSDWIIDQVKSVKASRVGTDLSYLTPLANKVKEKLAGSVEVIDIGPKITDMRAVKDESELSLMREALRITEETITKVIPDLKPGLREYEVAAMLEGTMRFLGADGYAFETIVASGPNGAYPHSVPTRKTIDHGEGVVIDMGARFGGYCADITRTPVVGQPSQELKKVLEAVNEAINEAIDAVAPGVKVSEVDGKARKVLAKYGLDKYFIHSLGHGVGVEVHEKPRVAQGIDETLEAGMVITIEPGVYINGKLGVRIENMVLVTKSGREVMNKIPNIL